MTATGGPVATHDWTRIPEVSVLPGSRRRIRVQSCVPGSRDKSTPQQTCTRRPRPGLTELEPRHRMIEPREPSRPNVRAYNMMKKLLVLGIVVTVLLAAGGAVAYKMLNDEIQSGRMAERISLMAKEKAGLDIGLGKIRVVSPLSVEIRDFEIRARKAGGADIKLKSVRVSIALGSLIRGNPKLAKVTLVGPVFDVVRRLDGSINLADTFAAPESTAPRTEATPAAPPQPGKGASEPAGQPKRLATAGTLQQPPELPFEKIYIEGGQVSFRDASWPEGRRVNLLELAGRLSSVSGSSQLEFDLQCQLLGGTAGIKGGANLATQGVKAHCKISDLDGAQLASLSPEPLPVEVLQLPINLEVDVTHEGTLRNLTATMTLAGGELLVSGHGLSVSGMGGTLKLSGDTVDVVALSGNLAGAVPVEINGKVSDIQGARQLALVVDVKGADLAGLGGTGLATLPEGLQGTVSGQLTVQGPAASPKMQGQIKPKNLAWTAAVGDSKIPLKVSDGLLDVTPEKIDVGTLVIHVGDNPVTLAMVVEDYASTPRWKGSIEAAELDLDGLLALAPAVHRDRVTPYSPAGKISLRVETAGTPAAYTFSGQIVPKGVAALVPAGSQKLPVTVTTGLIRFDEKSASSENLVLDVDGATARLDLKVSPLIGDRAIHAEADVTGLQVARILPLVPAEHRSKIDPFGLAGNLSASGSVDMKGDKLTASGTLDAMGLSGKLNHQGQQIRFQIEKGVLKYSNDKVSTDELVVGLALGKDGKIGSLGLITLKGTLDPNQQPPALNLSVKGRKLDLRAAAQFLPPLPVRLEGAASFNGTVKGTTAAPLPDMAIDMAGIVVHHPSLGVPLKGLEGQVAYSGKDLIFRDAKVGLGQTVIAANGTLTDPAGEARLDGIALNGSILLDELPRALPQFPPSLLLQGKGTFQGKLRGNKAAAGIAGSGKFFRIVAIMIGQDGKKTQLDLAAVDAAIDATPLEYSINPLKAMVYGGQLTATIRGKVGGAIDVNSHVKGANLELLMSKMQNMPDAFSGSADADVKMRIPAGAGAAGIDGSGNSVIRQLVLNGKVIVAIAKQSPALKTAATMGGIARFAGQLAGRNTMVGRLSDEAESLNDRLKPMFAYAETNHRFGTVHYDVQIDKGVVSGPVRTEGGPGRIDGDLTIFLADSIARGGFDVFTTDGTRSLEISNIVLDNSRTVPVSTKNLFDDVRFKGPAPAQAAPAPAATAAPTAEPLQPQVEKPEEVQKMEKKVKEVKEKVDFLKNLFR